MLRNRWWNAVAVTPAVLMLTSASAVSAQEGTSESTATPAGLWLLLLLIVLGTVLSITLVNRAVRRGRSNSRSWLGKSSVSTPPAGYRGEPRRTSRGSRSGHNDGFFGGIFGGDGGCGDSGGGGDGGGGCD